MGFQVGNWAPSIPQGDKRSVGDLADSWQAWKLVQQSSCKAQCTIISATAPLWPVSMPKSATAISGISWLEIFIILNHLTGQQVPHSIWSKAHATIVCHISRSCKVVCFHYFALPAAWLPSRCSIHQDRRGSQWKRWFKQTLQTCCFTILLPVLWGTGLTFWHEQYGCSLLGSWPQPFQQSLRLAGSCTLKATCLVGFSCARLPKCKGFHPAYETWACTSILCSPCWRILPQACENIGLLYGLFPEGTPSHQVWETERSDTNIAWNSSQTLCIHTYPQRMAVHHCQGYLVCLQSDAEESRAGKWCRFLWTSSSAQHR